MRADFGITFHASAALPIDAPYAVDILSIMNLCLCFSFVVCSMVESNISVFGCIQAQASIDYSREYRLFDLALAERKRRTSYSCRSVER